MHLNDQGTTTPDGLPLEPINPTNNVPPVVPGTIADNSTSDPSSPPIEAPLDNQEASNPEPPTEPESPDWFMKDKFKSIDEQAKSYKELSTKMGKYWGSPQENYAVEGLEGIDVLWIDEGQAITKQTLDVLIPTIRKEKAKIFFSMNRHVEHDPVYETFYNRPDCLHIHLNYLLYQNIHF